MAPPRPAKRGAQHVGQHLGLDEVDAQGLRHVLVLADGHPGAAQAGAAQPLGHEGDDGRAGERDVVDLDGAVEEVVPAACRWAAGCW